MFIAILNKELKALLLSPRFAATFAAASILVLLSVEIGIREYQNAVRQTDTARRLSAPGYDPISGIFPAGDRGSAQPTRKPGLLPASAPQDRTPRPNTVGPLRPPPQPRWPYAPSARMIRNPPARLRRG